MVLTQYADLFSLVIYTALLVPAIILGVCGKNSKWYGMLISIPCFMLIFGATSLQMLQFLIFIFCEVLLIYLYYLFHKRSQSEFVYFIVFCLSFIPIILIKTCVFVPKINFLGFIGISYISFRVWQMIIEIHDGHIEKLSIFKMLYFITFFPTISSGPIDRYNRFIRDLDVKVAPKDYTENFLIQGFKKIFLGIAYKFVLATLINTYVIAALPEKITLETTLIYMYAYTLYLFFDFAGYSNFAIGTSYLLGIKVPENFNKPFLARNMKEFWERWHISLSKWFGDYLFSRFVLNTLRNKTFKSKKMAVKCGYMVTMTTMGLWHGFSLHYILYGVYQGLMMVITEIYMKSKVFKKFKVNKAYNIVSRVVCFHVIALGMLLFSGYLF